MGADCRGLCAASPGAGHSAGHSAGLRWGTLRRRRRDVRPAHPRRVRVRRRRMIVRVLGPAFGHVLPARRRIQHNPQIMQAGTTTIALPDARMRALSAAPREALASIQGVMTDIDDTLTRDGAIEPAALCALHALHEAGLPVIAITGRPMGWSEPFAAAWPVDAIVAENGAVALIPQGSKACRPGRAQGPAAPASPAVSVEYAQDDVVRSAHALRLRQVAARVLREVRGRRWRATASGASPTSPSTTRSSPTSTRRPWPRWSPSCASRA